jgi:SAM-dependent methyltransferase
VSVALLEHGLRLVGVDLSAEMVERARKRCSAHGDRAKFLKLSVFDKVLDALGPFDAAISRLVLHHVIDPAAFVRRQVELIREGGALVVCDHLTDPDPAIAAHHTSIEVARDHTHTRCLTSGQLADLLAGAGLRDIRLVEERYTLDFDEWFDRGSPREPKETVRNRLVAGPAIRSFHAHLERDGTVGIDCVRAIVRGVKP